MVESSRVHGLVVRSEVPLHQGRPLVDDRPDLRVVTGAPRHIPAEPHDGELLGRHDRGDGVAFSSVVRTPNGFVLRCHGVCDLAIDAGLGNMTVHRDPDAPVGLESVVLGGMGLATVLMLRGHLLLHASAVEVAGRAVAVVGQSGRGKSTVATLLCASGARMVTDDVLRVDLDEGRPAARLGSTEARLRDAARATAPAGADRRETPDGRSAVSLQAATTDPLPLDVVVVPQPDRDASEVTLEVHSRADALVVLSSFPRLVGWIDPVTSGRQFRLLADLVRQVPVVTVRLPWGPPFLPDLAERLLDALAAHRAEGSAVSGSR